jgi:hypothetical protein
MKMSSVFTALTMQGASTLFVFFVSSLWYAGRGQVKKMNQNPPLFSTLFVAHTLMFDIVQCSVKNNPLIVTPATSLSIREIANSAV